MVNFYIANINNFKNIIKFNNLNLTVFILIFLFI